MQVSEQQRASSVCLSVQVFLSDQSQHSLEACVSFCYPAMYFIFPISTQRNHKVEFLSTKQSNNRRLPPVSSISAAPHLQLQCYSQKLKKTNAVTSSTLSVNSSRSYRLCTHLTELLVNSKTLLSVPPLCSVSPINDRAKATNTAERSRSMTGIR